MPCRRFRRFTSSSDNGHVTLTGVVSTDMEKEIAGMRASGAGLSFGAVTNNLEVEHPAKKS